MILISTARVFATRVRSTARDAEDRLFEVLSNRWILVALTIFPALILFAFVLAIPISWAVFAGFHEVSAYSPEWTWVGVENYVELLRDSPEFWTTLWRSLVFAGGSVALQLSAGVAIGLLINREFKYGTVIRGLVMLPYLVPTAVVGFIALWMGNAQFGIVNQVLVRFGPLSEAIPWFGSLTWAMLAVIVTSSWKFTIFVSIMTLARLQSIPDGYYEAAKVAGASSLQIFRDITLPNLKGVIFIVLLLRGVWMFNKFDIIDVLTGGGPKDVTETAPLYAYRIGFESGNLGMAAAISTFLFITIVITAMLYFFFLQPAEEVRVE